MATSRPFAYNTGAPIAGTEQLGSLAIGIPTTGFTNSPKFYMGPDEDNGYVVAGSVSGNTQPSSVSGETASLQFWRTKTKTDNEFILLAQSISKFTQIFASASAAKTWLNNNNYWTSYSAGIITNGLLINLDASNPASYPGTGTTWTDLSGNGYNGTLQNGAVYNAANGGSIILDGVDDKIVINSFLWSVDNTVSFFVYPNSNGSNFARLMGSKDFAFDISVNSANQIKYYTPGTGWVQNIVTLTGGAWNYLTFANQGTSLTIYINGVASYNGSLQPGSGGDVYIGSNFVNNDENTNIRVGNFEVYNRKLSESEVQQNFNLNKSRFGL